MARNDFTNSDCYVYNLYLQGKVVAQGTFEYIAELATVKEDNPQSVILREVLSEMLGEGEEEEEAHKDHGLGAIKEEEKEKEDVFTKSLPPASPPTLPTPSAPRPRVFTSKPQLLRRVTDMDLMRRCPPLSPLQLSPATPKFKRLPSKYGPALPPGSPRASRYSSQRRTPTTAQPALGGAPQVTSGRVSQSLFKRPAPFLRSATVGAFSTRRRSSGFQSGQSVAPVAGKWLSKYFQHAHNCAKGPLIPFVKSTPQQEQEHHMPKIVQSVEAP